MKKLFLPLLVLCLLSLSIPALAGPAPANMDRVDVTVPVTVGRGKPFLLHMTSWYPLDDLKVEWLGKVVHPEIRKEGGKYTAWLLLGIGIRERLGAYPLVVTGSFWGRSYRYDRVVDVEKSVWQRETLTVDPKKVIPPKSALARIKREHEEVSAMLSTFTPHRYWSLPLTRPVKGKMLSRFGLYRIFNGHTKARHTGQDFRAWKGTPIHAVAPGRVVLVEKLYYSGNSVYIDHGNGVFSLYGHMSKVLVRQGDTVHAGQTVGLSGATGRVTGAHLHLGLFVLGRAVDPKPFFDGGPLVENVN